MFYVYVLKCKDGSLYTGYTNNLQRRFDMHSAGKASKYTRSRLPIELVASWKYATKSQAMRAEIAFKRLSRENKLRHLTLNQYN